MMPSHYSDEEYQAAYESQHRDWSLNRTLLGIFMPVWACEALALCMAIIMHQLQGMFL